MDDLFHFSSPVIAWIFWIILLIIAVFIFKKIKRAVKPDEYEKRITDVELDALEKNYQKGIIDKEEYERKKKEIT